MFQRGSWNPSLLKPLWRAAFRLLDTERDGFWIGLFGSVRPRSTCRWLKDWISFLGDRRPPPHLSISLSPSHAFLTARWASLFLSFLSKHTVLGTGLRVCAAPQVMVVCFRLEHLGVNKRRRLNTFGSLGKVDCRKKTPTPAKLISMVFPVTEKPLSLNSPFLLLPARLFFLISSTSLGYLHYQRVCNPD